MFSLPLSSTLNFHGYENAELPVDPEVLTNLLLQLDPYKFMDLMGFI